MESKEITINNDLEKCVCKLYNPGGTCLGKITNEIAFLDARVQIKEKGLRGYYIMYKGQKIRIDQYGGMEEYPDGLFDKSLNLLLKLTD